MPAPPLKGLFRLMVDSGRCELCIPRDSPPRIRVPGELKPREALLLLEPAGNFAMFRREATRADYCDGITGGDKSTAPTATGLKVGGRIGTYQFGADLIRCGDMGTKPYHGEQ